MPYIMNALDRKVSTQAHGKYFTWQPGEIKLLHNQHLAEFLYQHRGEEGLVEIPDSVMEMDKNSFEYREAIAEKKKEGVAKRIGKLDMLKRNLMGSLRFDVESKGLKVDALTFASKGELEAMKELSGLKEYENRTHVNTAEEIRKVLEGIENGGSGTTDTGKINTGSTNTIKPAKS